MNRPTSTSRGFALPLVLVVLSIVALAVASVGYTLQASSAEAGRIVGEIRGAAACDSMVNIAAATVQLRLKENAASTMDELVEAVCFEARGCETNSSNRRVPKGLAPDGVELEDFYVGYIDDGVPIGIRPIPTGGFTNLLAEERLLGVYVQGRDRRSGRECRAEEDLTIATLSPLQFDLFVEPAGELKVSSPTTFTRMHRNNQLELVNVGVEAGAAGHLTTANDARLGTGVVPPPMQAPNKDEATAMRFIVDPAAENDGREVMKSRLAHLADIRIVDGVWYLRDDTLKWPGRPIWSDHPGSVSHAAAAKEIVQADAAIGQTDLFPSGSRPSRYSYYETDANGLMTNANGGVVSYGTMFATPQGPTPGLWPSYAASDSSTDICGGHGEFANAAACGNVDQALVEGTRSGFEHDGADILPINFDVEAFAAALNSRAAGELGTHFPTPDESASPRQFNGIIWISQTWRGASTGLKVGSTLSVSVPKQGKNNKGSALGPKRVCAPLATEDIPNETGGLPSEDGLPVPIPGNGNGGGGGEGEGEGPIGNPPPNPDGTEGNGQPVGQSPITAPVACPEIVPSGAVARAQASVPMTICGGGFNPDDVIAGGFKIAPCAGDQFGADGGDGAAPNALRVVRAALVDARDFPLGLTIATNLPMYVQGDVNSAPLASGLARRKVLLAADRVTLLSAQFRDDQRPWGTHRALKQAGSSTIVASFITGVPKGGNFNQAFRAAEDWRQDFAIIKGSLLFGFYSVYDKKIGSTVGISRGLRLERDEHLLDPLVQPPGTPRVIAGVTGRWRR